MTVGIGQRLAEEMKPQWLRIGGYWYPRGGMPIDVFWQSGPPPEGLWLPDQGVAALPRPRLSIGRGPRIAVLGAGSVGCFIGGVLGRRRGCRSRFIGRPKMSQDIHEHGLTLSDYTRLAGALCRRGRLSPACPRRSADAEIIALCVKSGATAEAARDIAQHAPDGAMVISFQNGISNVEVLERELGGRFEVVRGMVPFNVAYLGDGRFHKGVAGAAVCRATARKRGRWRNAIGGGPAALKLSDDMLGVAWGKLLINLNNAVNALVGPHPCSSNCGSAIIAGSSRRRSARGCELLDARRDPAGQDRRGRPATCCRR